MAEEATTEDVSEFEDSENQQTQVPTLDLQDLAKVLNLLNIAIKRGAYEPNELANVGTTYSKLEAFLKYQAQVQAAQKEKEGEA